VRGVSTARLVVASYIALGVTARRGPTTSYDLKRYVAESIGYFWPIPHAQLYAEPLRLEELGLLRSRSESGGRRRRFFEITDAGREALATWLADPSTDSPELRDTGLLKLHFGALATPDDVRALGEHQRVVREERLRRFLEFEQQYDGRPGQEHQLVTLRLGQAYERMFAAFWQQVADSAEDLADGRVAGIEMRFVDGDGDRV